ncbi:MAG: hypothetical protein PVI90_08620 [Desulfobacteraceae bacterium]|jgi:hypothetical protein
MSTLLPKYKQSNTAIPNNIFNCSQKWLYALFIITTIAINLIVIDSCVRSRYQDTAAIQQMRSLGLSRVVIAPADSPLSHPEMYHSGIDLRFSPLLPFNLNSTGIFLKILPPVSTKTP